MVMFLIQRLIKRQKIMKNASYNCLQTFWFSPKPQNIHIQYNDIKQRIAANTNF